MENILDIHVSRDKMTASLSFKEVLADETLITVEELKSFLKERKITFGFKEENLQKLSSRNLDWKSPLIVAEGIAPIHGSNGYLIDKTVSEEKVPVSGKGEKSFNFRNVIRIPSVTKGQMLAVIVPPNPGIPGKNVYGAPILAKDGKPIKLRPGKNVLFHSDQVISLMDGQVSITSNSVNVFPVFEVNGDLDLKTGNIDFIGNVTIRGNVPSGYEIKAGGDIYINGLVENATLNAGGSITIIGGITGTGKGIVKAGVAIHAAYLNQANVKAGGDIFIESSILHSYVESEGRVICKKGHIIGGEIVAHKGLETNDIGNLHYMQTVIHIGNFREIIEKETYIHKELKILKESLNKLSLVCKKLNIKKESAGVLSPQERAIYDKSQSTEKSMLKKMEQLNDELLQLKEELDHDVHIVARSRIYPNTQIHFGKYSKPVSSVLQHVKLSVSEGDIVSIPL